MLLWASAGCGEQIVYRDQPNFENPPTAAAGFLGLSDVTANRTTCGNCHVGKQGTWQQTAHAGAWNTLKNSGQSKTECESCHSVSSLGNVVTETSVGYVSTKSARYQNVQCESCHGPGLTHVTNPDVPNTKPLAPLAVSPILTRGCGECHSGSHRPFAEEWSKSRHARVIDSRATNPSCIGCHEAKGVLQAWGIRSTFLEGSGETQNMAITCAVCHDPHDARNPGQLRFPLDVPSLETNLCMKCHYRRAQPEVTSSSGPHSPQGPVLLGEAGWFPPNFQFPPKSLVGSHGSDRNPRLCATCHVNNYVVNDKVTGAFTFRATGHSFQPIPCVDANGIPTGVTTCDIAQRSFKACVTCHLSETAARAALSVARVRIGRLADQVDSLLKRVPTTEFSTTDNRISTGEGSKFNMQLAREAGAAAHNPFLIEALLLESIRQIGVDYKITPTSRISMTPELAPPETGRD
jgi:predicted CXXCH cytochrome family protein